MQGNRLEKLDQDVFEGNPELELIYLVSNDLKYIHANILQPLSKLKRAYFNSNRCTNMDATSPATLISLKDEFQEKCPVLNKQIILLEGASIEVISLIEKLKHENGKLKNGMKVMKTELISFWESEIMYCKKQLLRISQCLHADDASNPPPP